jgi:hypothetical protein
MSRENRPTKQALANASWRLATLRQATAVRGLALERGDVGE